jgi:hypothetical protein
MKDSEETLMLFRVGDVFRFLTDDVHLPLEAELQATFTKVGGGWLTVSSVPGITCPGEDSNDLFADDGGLTRVIFQIELCLERGHDPELALPPTADSFSPLDELSAIAKLRIATESGSIKAICEAEDNFIHVYEISEQHQSKILAVVHAEQSA